MLAEISSSLRGTNMHAAPAAGGADMGGPNMPALYKGYVDWTEAVNDTEAYVESLYQEYAHSFFEKPVHIAGLLKRSI
jgi:hypothetical protein